MKAIYLTVTQYAKRKKISRQAALKHIATGKIKAIKKKATAGRYGTVYLINAKSVSNKQLKLSLKWPKKKKK